MGTPWLIVVVLGPILLLLFVGYSLLRNKLEKRPGDEARSDAAAKQLHDRLNREDKARERDIDMI
jgi:hypothetical protein